MDKPAAVSRLYHCADPDHSQCFFSSGCFLDLVDAAFFSARLLSWIVPLLVAWGTEQDGETGSQSSRKKGAHISRYLSGKPTPGLHQAGKTTEAGRQSFKIERN